MIAARASTAAWVLLSFTALACSHGASPGAAGPERAARQGPFVVKPYLQFGEAPRAGELAVVWHADDVDAGWAVDVRPDGESSWRPMEPPKFRRVAVAGVEPHRVYRATLRAGAPGGRFAYRVRDGKGADFEAEALAPKSASQPHRFAVFGDCGAGTPEERRIAHRTFEEKPDFVMIPGDIIYDRGRASEYRTRFWPAYNADRPAPDAGAPLLRSTLFVAAAGNHDIAARDLAKYPDGLAYFYYWCQPLNGPTGPEGGPLVAPVTGSPEQKKAFLDAAGEAFPRMANFSFDYGNAHWIVLDANATVDWADPAFRRWVEDDLAAAKDARWRFVCYHQPGFNSSRSHFDEQHTRVLSPVFEAGKVDLVFNGHVHNYQRSYPLRFAPTPVQVEAPAFDENGRMVPSHKSNGRLTLDRSFDGKDDTTPEGVIYIVTGAGGNRLYNPEQQDDPSSWQPFTVKHISRVHSLTVVDVDDSKLTLRQVSADGEELDRIVVTK
ncbi:Calcineurin-like phosphoesterase [Aquisphaera giovannonii]|uniref:Calcineurin-like phosphoesterase n=1 Tax=Aquisphaera giovannonii TaxID=406548 RepID=A0A5B9VWR5_9BACT|nr:metallophosphoesterase [Aquisphaera giovannonii]QEH32387.1 Calcineurin-like phosphoesterase [Aquisphaera giovannonii]